MTTQTRTQEKQERPKGIFFLYLQGLAAYLYFRLLAVLETIFYAPLHLIVKLKDGWQYSLKPWLARHKKRIFWSIVAVICLSGLIGGAVVLYLWRDSLPSFRFNVKDHFVRLTGRFQRRAAPIVVVATAPVEEIPAVPAGNNTGLK